MNCRIRSLAILAGFLATSQSARVAWPHDIPNQRIDRSIQVTLSSSRLVVDYEVSLTELTLTQDLRSLIGNLPGADRAQWLARYAEVTGPQNAKGLLVSVNSRAEELVYRGHDLVVEEHPRYTFHFEAAIPDGGRLTVRDTNYTSSEGTSRLAIRGRDGLIIEGDDRPAEVDQIQIRPVWQLSNEDERRTKEATVRFRRPSTSENLRPGSEVSQPIPVTDAANRDQPASIRSNAESNRPSRISELLDKRTGLSSAFIALIALCLGAAHAVQPGHGKTLVTAVALSPDARWYQAMLLGFSATLAHLGSVLLVALALWYTGATAVGTVHRGLSQVAGFAIAAAGFWRVGRHLGGYAEHALDDFRRVRMSSLGIVGLGLANGLVPCWDAVGLLVLAASLGRLATGVNLVIAFSLGMAMVLAAVAWVAWTMKSATFGWDRSPIWQHRLGLVSGLMLAAIGLYLFFV